MVLGIHWRKDASYKEDARSKHFKHHLCRSVESLICRAVHSGPLHDVFRKDDGLAISLYQCRFDKLTTGILFGRTSGSRGISADMGVGERLGPQMLRNMYHLEFLASHRKYNHVENTLSSVGSRHCCTGTFDKHKSTRPSSL